MSEQAASTAPLPPVDTEVMHPVYFTPGRVIGHVDGHLEVAWDDGEVSIHLPGTVYVLTPR